MANINKITLPNGSTYNLIGSVHNVIGTQTASTNVWTGNLNLPALYDGLTINYYLPWAGTSTSATLNLTLADGTTTGAKNCYYGNNTRLTTHYSKGSNIVMTYYSAGSIKIDGTATTDDRWIANANYDSNSDTKTRQTLQTDNTDRPILLSYANNTNTTANIDNVVYRNNSIYANPSTGTITATTFVGNATDSTKLPLAGGTLTGRTKFNNVSMPLSGGRVTSLTAGTTEVFKDGIAISNPATSNDVGWIRVTGTGESDTVMEIATGDDAGAGEQIVVRQYNTSNTVGREAKLFDTAGNTSFPNRLKAGKSFNNIITGSGTAAQDKGSGVSPRYFPAKWTFNTGLTATDGDIITIKIPVAGHDYGVFMSIDNGTNYYPIVCNSTGRLTTNYPVNNYITVVFEPSGSAASMFPVAGGDSRVTVTGGVWRVINYYDSNSNDTGYYLRRIFPNIKAGSNKIFPYTLIMQLPDGRWESIVTSSSTGTSKARNTHGFLLTNLLLMYANATYNENVAVGTYNIWHEYTGLIDHRYSFNTANDATNGTTGYKPVYIVGSLGNDGLFYLDTKWWTQTLPTGDDGKLYIYIGDAYDYYRLTFVTTQKIYWYKNGAIREFAQDSATVTGHTVAKDVPSNAVFTDTNNAVTQTATSTNANYEVLFSGTADNTTRTEGARKYSNLKFNPSTGTLTATKFSGALAGDVTGNVTGNLTGNVTGNCSGSSGSCTGNAATATSATSATSASRLTLTNITIQTGSSTQQKISLQTLMTWLITTKSYIPSGTAVSVVIKTSWNYAGNDILQLSVPNAVGTETNYELQLAGVLIEFDGNATNYNTGEFRLRIHSSPTTSFTPTSGYTRFPVDHIAEYTCNGNTYSPVWRMISVGGDIGVNTTSVGSASAGTAISADDITAWSAGTATSASVSLGVLTITNGTAPSLSYTAKSIPNISVSSKTVVTGLKSNV